jgi:DNA repair exonuclease SbcCD ATPase subunit
MLKIGETKARELINDIDAIRKKIITLAKVEKPEATAKEKVLEEQLQELNNQLLSKKNEINGPSPFIKILDTTIEECKARQKDCESKKLELDEANDELPYYEFWVKAFGENGIRKFIIDGIIPALNTRVAHWLEFLIDSKIKLEFDNQLQEKIERNPSDGDDFVYYAMSGGERRRLNLAVSQAFAHIMMLNSGYYPSLVFLDEVTTNIDPIGVQGVYNMIIELAKERQVFITTHDHDLLEMLNGCETINLVKKGGFTTIKN